MYVSVRLCLRLRVRGGHAVCHTSKLLQPALEHLFCGLNAVRFLDFFEYLLTHSLHARIQILRSGDARPAEGVAGSDMGIGVLAAEGGSAMAFRGRPTLRGLPCVCAPSSVGSGRLTPLGVASGAAALPGDDLVKRGPLPVPAGDARGGRSGMTNLEEEDDDMLVARGIPAE